MGRRSPLGRLAVLGLLAGASLTVPAHAQEPPASRLGANITAPGVITLAFVGRPGATVYFDERVGGKLKRLGALPVQPNNYAVLRDATVWRCDRLERHFEATAINPDGSRAAGAFGVRTGSCGQRFALVTPQRVRVGAHARIRVFDRWRIGGYSTKLCLKLPHEARSCRALKFPRGVSVASRSAPAAARGRLTVELRVGKVRVRRSIVVGTGGTVSAPPRLLATGDSTIQGVDNFLADRLGSEVEVRGEPKLGTAISRGSGWIPRAARQAAKLRPRITVISIGASDGNPMPTPSGAVAPCCDEPWIAEYARRVSLMMKSYSRRGKGHVLWLTLPAPRNPAGGAVAALVNHAILRAAQGRPTVRVLRFDKLFAPHGFTEVIRYHGQNVRIRAVDGVHLNIAGQAIAAEEIEHALRAWPATGIPAKPSRKNLAPPPLWTAQPTGYTA